MARDVKFWKEDGSFKLRVCGVIENDGKYLMITGEGCDFWGFPGGHVEIGEDSDSAVLREIFEETGIETSIQKLLATVQLFFTREDGAPFHEIGFYYLLSPRKKINSQDFYHEEIDKGEFKHHDYNWKSLDEMKNIQVRPSEIISILENGLERQHIICDRRKIKN